jgi:8-oxo-dGTP pyrophosphatase MutT (NUDIX family)
VFDHHAVPGQPTTSFNNMAFDIERAALPLFGFPNYGCLLTGMTHYYLYGRQITVFVTAYIRDVNNQLKLWIPQRSMKKKTCVPIYRFFLYQCLTRGIRWPGALDVTVGGGIETCSSALKTIIRECTEEASLPTAFVQDHAQFTSILPFPNRSPSGWILPGRYFLFEMELPGDGSIQPELNPADTEVESFHLMDVEEVLHSLADGKFKSSSALAMIRFLIGHGAITEHSEPQFGTICRVLEGNAA